MDAKAFGFKWKGAKELIKGMLWSALSYMTLMIPMSIIIMFLNEVLSPVLSGEQVAPNLFLYIGLGVVAILLMIPFHWLQYGSVFIATYNESANKRVTLAENCVNYRCLFWSERCQRFNQYNHEWLYWYGARILSCSPATRWLINFHNICYYYVVYCQLANGISFVLGVSYFTHYGIWFKKLQDRAGQAHLDAK